MLTLPPLLWVLDAKPPTPPLSLTPDPRTENPGALTLPPSHSACKLCLLSLAQVCEVGPGTASIDWLSNFQVVVC